MYRNDGRVDIIDLINGILGSLVSITAGCFLYRAWEAILIGAIGAFLTCITMPIFDKWSVDDPVGASSVHGVCGIWGKLNLIPLYSVAMSFRQEQAFNNKNNGRTD